MTELVIKNNLHISNLFLYVIVQVCARFGKISRRVWPSHGLYFGDTVGQLKLETDTKQVERCAQT